MGRRSRSAPDPRATGGPRRQCWVELTVKVSPEAAPGMADVLLAAAHGVEERGTRSQVHLVAYLPAEHGVERLVGGVKERLEALRAAGLRVGAGDVTVRRTRSQRWEQAWKAGFEVVKVGQRIVIKPTWKRYKPAEGEVVVELDPGMAFGTGQHATTRACLDALARTMRSGDTVFDIGAGSGILSIAAARLGAEHVVAVEVDQSAARIARENVNLNGVAETVLVICGRGLEAIRGRADVIVANLTAPQIIELAAQVVAHLSRCGIFIASGIAADGEQPQQVRQALEALGMTMREAVLEEEWATLIWEHGADEMRAPALRLVAGWSPSRG